MIKALPQLRQLNNENVESEDDDCSDDKKKKSNAHVLISVFLRCLFWVITSYIEYFN